MVEFGKLQANQASLLSYLFLPVICSLFLVVQDIPGATPLQNPHICRVCRITGRQQHLEKVQVKQQLSLKEDGIRELMSIWTSLFSPSWRCEATALSYSCAISSNEDSRQLFMAQAVHLFPLSLLLDSCTTLKERPFTRIQECSLLSSFIYRWFGNINMNAPENQGPRYNAILLHSFV